MIIDQIKNLINEGNEIIGLSYENLTYKFNNDFFKILVIGNDGIIEEFLYYDEILRNRELVKACKFFDLEEL